MKSWLYAAQIVLMGAAIVMGGALRANAQAPSKPQIPVIKPPTLAPLKIIRPPAPKPITAFRLPAPPAPGTAKAGAPPPSQNVKAAAPMRPTQVQAPPAPPPRPPQILIKLPFDGLDPAQVAKGASCKQGGSPGAGLDASAVCDCAQQYVTAAAKQADAIRARANARTATAQATHARIYPMTPKLGISTMPDYPYGAAIYEAAYVGDHYREAAMLDSLWNGAGLACKSWAGEKSRAATLVTTEANLVSDLDAARGSYDAANRENRAVVSQIGWGSDPAIRAKVDGLHAQLLALNARISADGVGIGEARRALATLDSDFHEAKRSAYEAVTVAASDLWTLNLQEINDQITTIAGEQMAADTDAKQAHADWFKGIDAKWAPILIKQLEDQGNNASKVLDYTGIAADEVPFAEPFDRKQSVQLNATIQRMKALLQDFFARRQQLKTDLQSWADRSAQDNWPSAALHQRQFDYQRQHWQANYSFEDLSHLLLDPAVQPAPAAPSPRGAQQRAFGIIEQSGLTQQRRDLSAFAFTASSDRPGGVKFIGEYPNVGIGALTFRSDGSVAAFWQAHPQWKIWHGSIPADVKAYDSYTNAAVTPIDQLVEHAEALFVINDPLGPANGDNVYFASGADDHARP